MSSDITSIDSVQSALSIAFRGVRLGSGLSIRQTEAVDRYGDGLTDEEFKALSKQEITNDWSAIAADDLERIAVAHLDPEGYRYYIPALALSILKNYDPGSMRVIGTILSLHPREPDREYHMSMYSALSDAQKRAIGLFLEKLPQLVELEPEDATSIHRALRNYWSQYSS